MQRVVDKEVVWFLHPPSRNTSDKTTKTRESSDAAPDSGCNSWSPTGRTSCDDDDNEVEDDHLEEDSVAAKDPNEMLGDGRTEDARSDNEQSNQPAGQGVHSPLMTAEIRRYLSYLPKIYAGKIAKKGAPPEFATIVDNLNLPVRSPLLSGAPDADAGKFRKIMIICPYVFWERYTPSQLKCPYCWSGDNVFLNGFVPGAVTLVSPEGHTAVVARRFRCKGCSHSVPGKSSRYFSALHEDVIKQLDPAVQFALPFRAFKRKLVHLSVVDMMTSLRTSGTGIATMARALRCTLTTQHLRAWRSYNATIDWAIRHGSVSLATARSFGEFRGHVISEQLLKRMWFDDHKRRLRDTLAYLCTFVSTTLKWDHTFYSTKHAREDSTAVASAQIGVADAEGCLLASAFTRTKVSFRPSSEK